MHSFLMFLNSQPKMEMLLWYTCLLFFFPIADQLHHITLIFLKFYSREKQLTIYSCK